MDYRLSCLCLFPVVIALQFAVAPWILQTIPLDSFLMHLAVGTGSALYLLAGLHLLVSTPMFHPFPVSVEPWCFLCSLLVTTSSIMMGCHLSIIAESHPSHYAENVTLSNATSLALNSEASSFGINDAYLGTQFAFRMDPNTVLEPLLGPEADLTDTRPASIAVWLWFVRTEREDQASRPPNVNINPQLLLAYRPYFSAIGLLGARRAELELLSTHSRAREKVEAILFKFPQLYERPSLETPILVGDPTPIHRLTRNQYTLFCFTWINVALCTLLVFLSLWTHVKLHRRFRGTLRSPLYWQLIGPLLDYRAELKDDLSRHLIPDVAEMVVGFLRRDSLGTRRGDQHAIN